MKLAKKFIVSASATENDYYSTFLYQFKLLLLLLLLYVFEQSGCVPAVTITWTVVCCKGSSRKLLNHKVVQFTATNELPFEDSHQFLHEKSSPAITNPFLQTDHMTLKEETFATDLSFEEDEQGDIVNYTLASDLDVLEAGPWEAGTGTGHDGVVDAAGDISKFPSKNDL